MAGTTVPLELTSLANPGIKAAAKLRQRRQRDRQRRFLIEGQREIAAALEANWPLETLYYCAKFFARRDEEALLHRCRTRNVACYATNAAVFGKLAYRDNAEGMLAVAPMPRLYLAGLPAPQAAKPPLYLVAAGIEKPGNLGAMLRTASAAGAAGLIVADSVVDVFNPNVVRASLGALFRLPVAVADGDAARAWLLARNIKILAASPAAATSYDCADWRGSTAIVIGSEADGLAADWLAAADSVRIPLAGGVDSLNASIAASVLLFEARRQRLVGARP